MENKEEKKLWRGWAASFILALACFLAMQYVFPVNEILRLEFARSKDSMDEIIMGIDASTNAGKYNILKVNTIVDYGFLIGYSLLALYSLKLLLHGLELKNHYKWVYILAFATGFWDCIENIFLLISAANENAYYSCIFFWVVRIKWAFAIVVLTVIPFIALFGFILLTRGKRETKNA